MDGLLRRNRFREAVMRMECALLEEREVQEELLRQIPDSYLNASPLLLQALGNICYGNGQLSEARQRFEQAMKGFGAMALPARLLSAMCALVQVQLRMGDLASAETLLLFLKTEYERTPSGEREGGLPRALAAGSRLIDADAQAKMWYLEAVVLYERKLQMDQAACTLAELITQCGAELHPKEWRDLEWKLKRWSAVTEDGSLSADWIISLQNAQLERWEHVYSQLKRQVHSPFRGRGPYYILVGVQVAFFRAALQVCPEEAAAFADRLSELKKQYPSDMQLQHALLLAEYDWLLRLELAEEAKAVMQEAGRIARHLRLPNCSSSPDLVQEPETIRIEQPKPQAGWWIRFFGGLTVGRGAEEVRNIRWKRRKAQELCVYLLLQPKYTCAKEQLIEILELGEDPEKAAKSLYVIIHQLKQTLHEQLSIHEGVYSREGLVILREDAFEYVDVERYLTLLRVADQLWLKDRPLAYEFYLQAYALYDELLPELPYISWLENMREYVLEKQVAVIRKLCLMAEEQQETVLEEMYCREWIDLKPYQEEACQRFMRLLIRTHRQSEAAEVYERFAQWCRDELGTEPSEETYLLLGGSTR
ncbi:BTAD domain-containing putative transcriptional regulator [Paenibacillus validus]|uniref:AfsR/SARP family transcriptional regulator n=2 Tax=Paenibacillus TaxID=44249 RepID=UPI003D26B8A1